MTTLTTPDLKAFAEPCVSLSTAHITAQDDDLLTRLSNLDPFAYDPSNPPQDLAIYRVGRGYLIVCSHWSHADDGDSNTKQLTDYGLSQDFANLLVLCFEQGFVWLILDGDAGICEELPTHDW